MNFKSILIAGQTYLRQLDNISAPLAIAAIGATVFFSNVWWLVLLVVAWGWYTFTEGMAAGVVLHDRSSREKMVEMLHQLLGEAVKKSREEGIPIDEEAVSVLQNSCSLQQRCAKNGKPRACDNCKNANGEQTVAALRRVQASIETHAKMRERKARDAARRAVNQAKVDAGEELDLPPLDEDFFSRM